MAVGSRTAPFATLERARQAVRNLKQKQGGQLKQPVSVLLAGGTYFLQSPLVFTPDDSGSDACPVIYSALGNERVVISGGRRLGEWRAMGDGLWRASVPKGSKDFRRLRVGQADAIRARTPNFDPQHPHTGGWWFTQFGGQPWEKGAFGQAVGSAQDVGTKLGWQVNVPATATYTVWLRYAHNMQSAMDEHTTLRSGNEAPVALTDLPDTGAWGSFRWGKVAVLPLAAGNQTLAWENVKGGGLNLDAFVLTDDPNWNPANADSMENLPTALVGKQRLVIQAEAATSKVGTPTIPQNAEGGGRDRIGLSAEQLIGLSDKDLAGAEVNIFPAWGWVNARLAVNGADRQLPALLVHSNEQIWMNNRFYVENARSALDSPGEWFLDEGAGEVLYKPRPSDSQKSVAVAPTMDRLVTLAGDATADKFVENIRFQGLTFSDTDYTLGGYYSQADSAFWLQGGRRCAIENCRFEHLGGYAVRMEQRSNGNAVVRCTMDHLGGGGVVMLGDTKSQAFDNLIAANDIHDCGQMYAHVAGVYITTGSGNKVLNNRIERMPRYGVSLKSYADDASSHNNVVAYNEIIDTNLETNDTGAIETLGRDKAESGNRIEYNLIRNVVGLKVTTDGVMHTPYFTWGIYLDDFSSGTMVRGNIVDGTVVGALCIHNGKDNVVENNVFLNGSEMNIRLQPHGDGFMHNNSFRHNIVAYKDPNAILWYSYANTWKRDILGEVDNNLYWQTGGLDLATTSQGITPEGTWGKWQEAGLDTHSQVANPQFEGLNRGDYRLKANSPAYKLGFQPLPLGRIGPKGYIP